MELKELIDLATTFKTERGDSLISFESILDRIIEYDRWKTEATFSHQLQLEELRLNSSAQRKTPQIKPDGEFSEEDQEFNLLSSYGACTEKHLGLIAKTKVWEGATDQSTKLFENGTITFVIIILSPSKI